MISHDYNYWIRHIEKFKEQYGERLEISNCSLEISNSYFKNSPEIRFGIIQMPSQYLDLLNFHCNLILCNRNLFQHIGDYSNEDLNQEYHKIPDYTLLPEDFKRTYLPNTLVDKAPLDNKRHATAALLRDMITFFVLHHEIGHARQASKIQEISYQDKEEETWEQQVREVDADIFAINWLWRTILLNYHSFTLTEGVNTKKQLLELCMFSTFLFFFLSNNCEPLINSYGTHPHPIIRFEITTIFLKNIVEDNISTAEFKTALQFAVPEFLKTIKYHFGGEDILAYRQKFKSTEVNEMKIIIQDYLEKNPSLNRNRVPDIG